MNNLAAFMLVFSLPALTGEQEIRGGQQTEADERVTLQDFPPRPQYDIRTIAWSPDGTRLALSVPGSPPGFQPPPGSIRVWDIASGKLVAGKVMHYARSLAWSSDGERLAVVLNPHGPVTGWNIKTGKEEFSLNTASRWNYFTNVAWSPDGERLAVSASGGSVDVPRKLHIWKLSSKELSSLDIPNESAHIIRSMAWSCDSTRLATGHVTGAVNIRSASGSVEATLLGHSGPVEFVAWSHDGKRLATATTKAIKIWDIPDRREVVTIAVEAWQFPCLAWSPDGTRLVSGAKDHSVHTWDVNTGQSVGTPRTHTEPVWAVMWLPKRNRIASLSADGVVETWEPGLIH